MTLHLRTLGQVQLSDDAGTELRSLLTQPKRLALLVYLASMSGDGRMCSRDALLAMFWPDSDGERARGSLRQAVHFIRQVAGSDIFETRGPDEIGLLADSVVTDSAAFESTVASGRSADAVALYTGGFLDGFVVRGAPAFDAWTEAERVRLRALVERAQPAPMAVPLSESSARWRVPALVAGVVAAVIAAFVFTMHPFRHTIAGGNDPNRMVVLPFVVRGSPSLRYLEDGLPILLGTRLDGAGSLRTVDARALIVQLAATKEDRLLTPQRAAEIAARFGAQLYVLGTVVGSGDTLRIGASLYDRAQGADPIAHTEVNGTEAALVHHVDRLASELLAARFREAGGSIKETAARTTSSLPALKAWLAGEAAITAGQYAAAMTPLREAIAADSTFALAHFRLAVAANWVGMPSLVDSEARRAVALSDRMSPSTRRVLEAFLNMRQGDYTHSAALLRQVVAEQPSSTEGWYELGDVLFHGNPPQGRSLVDAREAFGNALRLDPHNFSAAIHLARIAASTGDAPALDHLTQAALGASPDSAQRAEVFLLRVLTLSDANAKRTILALPATPGLLDALWRDTEYSGNLVTAGEIAAALLPTAPTVEMRASLQFFLAHVAMARERFAEADARIDSLAVSMPQSAAATRILFATHPALPDTLRDRRLARAAQLASHLPTGSRGRLYIGSSRVDYAREFVDYTAAIAQLSRGDSSTAVRLQRANEPNPAMRILQARLGLLLAVNESSRAAAIRAAEVVDSICGARFTSQSPFAPRVLYHLDVSRAMEQQGRVADAFLRLQAVPEDFGFNVAYLTEIKRRRAALLDRLGRGAEAVALRRAVAVAVKQ
ncbi:hypothetical protein BH09GEM1_BH09GEM1_26140 [soil metagenome]